MVLYEFATAADENPDVIGFALEAGSVLIECKLTRSDFLRDATKVVRKNPRAGMGQRRYYLCPPDVIQVKDLPPKWGLLWAAKGQVMVQREARGHPERNLAAEVRFLSSMLRRAQIRIGARPLSEWLERRESLRGKTRHVTQPTSSHSEGESHFSLSAINPELCPELEPTMQKAAGARRKLKYSGQGAPAHKVPRGWCRVEGRGPKVHQVPALRAGFHCTAQNRIMGV